MNVLIRVFAHDHQDIRVVAVRSVPGISEVDAQGAVDIAQDALREGRITAAITILENVGLAHLYDLVVTASSGE